MIWIWINSTVESTSQWILFRQKMVIVRVYVLFVLHLSEIFGFHLFSMHENCSLNALHSQYICFERCILSFYDIHTPVTKGYLPLTFFPTRRIRTKPTSDGKLEQRISGYRLWRSFVWIIRLLRVFVCVSVYAKKLIEPKAIYKHR